MDVLVPIRGAGLVYETLTVVKNPFLSSNSYFAPKGRPGRLLRSSWRENGDALLTSCNNDYEGWAQKGSKYDSRWSRRELAMVGGRSSLLRHHRGLAFTTASSLPAYHHYAYLTPPVSSLEETTGILL